MNELASICFFLVSNKYLLSARTITVLTDNLTACQILKKGIARVDEFQDGLLHRLILSVVSIPFKIIYVNTKNNPSDLILRTPGSAEMIDENCLKSTSMSDLIEQDSKTYKPEKTLEDIWPEVRKIWPKRVSWQLLVGTMKR